jgi:hypothetical protein
MIGTDLRVDRALQRATEAGRRAGFDVEGAAVTRVRSSIHVELPYAGVIARVEAADRMALAARQVVVAGVWAAQGAPVPVLVRPQLQPFVFDDAAVTLWQRLDGGATADLTVLGSTVKKLHDATRGINLTQVHRLEPFVDIEACVDSPPSWLADEDRDEIAHRYRRLRRWWDSESSDDPLGVGLVHGDVHRENTLVTDEHGVILVDLEDAGVGPLSWDLVPLAVGVHRYGDPPEEFQKFVAGYGVDPCRWSGFERMCGIYELSVSGWAIRCAAVAPRIAREAALRVAGLLGRSREAWTML